MLDSLPRHIGDVQQAVYATQVDKGTVIGEVLDNTFNNHAFGQVRQQLFALGAIGFFENRAATNNHIVALAIQLDNFEFELFALEVRGLANRAHINQGAGQECADSVDVNRKAAFDLATNMALDDLFCFVGFFQFDPGLSALGFLARQAGFPETVFYRFQRNLNFVTDIEYALTGVIEKLFLGNYAFRLQARVYGNPIIVDINHDTGHDRTGFHINGF